ncbi:permease prefix domain 1-containing protein [Alkalibacillus silvisoli]|uniref:DUF2157 domain-containing protein n=1 Tax=Alkalibacillus silvisoli TaxID=392823 RepID=A0ABN1A025_9BACI
MSKSKQYVESILHHVELNDENKRDMKEEFTLHINQKTKAYEKEGFSKKQAEEEAISEFGESREIGKELNREIFPFRTSFLILAGLSGLLFSLLVSILTFVFHESLPYVWFFIVLIANTSIFYFVRKPSKAASQRLILIILLLVIFLLNFYGFLLMDGLMQSHLLYYGLLGLYLSHALILFSQIYMGAMFQPVNVDLKMLSDQKRKTKLSINIFTGIIVLGVALFGLVGWLIFSPTSLPVIPLFLIFSWSCLFVCHLKIKKLENVARFLMIIFALFILVAFIYVQFASFT